MIYNHSLSPGNTQKPKSISFMSVVTYKHSTCVYSLPELSANIGLLFVLLETACICQSYFEEQQSYRHLYLKILLFMKP